MGDISTAFQKCSGHMVISRDAAASYKIASDRYQDFSELLYLADIAVNTVELCSNCLILHVHLIQGHQLEHND